MPVAAPMKFAFQIKRRPRSTRIVQISFCRSRHLKRTSITNPELPPYSERAGQTKGAKSILSIETVGWGAARLTLQADADSEAD